jgi:NAD(P)-dependent dehydrogenase (short-subunit alcohol dehydrogenase family)
MPVYAACLTASSAEQLQFKCRWLPGKLYTLTMDVRDTESVTKAKLFVEQNLQHTAGKAQFDINSVMYVACLHGIVNNAGIAGNAAPDDWLTLDDYHQVVDVNTFGVIRVSHAFKRLIKQSKGRIVTAASICARVCLPGTGTVTYLLS